MDKHRLSGGLPAVHRHKYLAVGMSNQTADTRLADRRRCNWAHCGLLASNWWGIRKLHTLKKEGIQMLACNLPLVGMGILQDSPNSPGIPYWADSQGPGREDNLTRGDIHLARHIQAASDCPGISLGTSPGICPRTSRDTVPGTSLSTGLEGDTWRLAHRGPWHPGARESGKQNKKCLKTD